MAPAERPVSDLMLERYALGELPPDAAGEITRRLENDAELAGRLAALRGSDGEILGVYPAAAMAERIRRRAAATRLQRWRLPAVLGAPTLAAAAAALLMVALPSSELRPEDAAVVADSGDRVKGLVPHLAAYRVRDGRAEGVGQGARLRPGDVVQIRYVAAGRPWGTVVSVDGSGAVTLHWPEQPTASAALEPEGEVSLPNAFELDAAPGYERFFFVTAPEPVPAERVLQAVRALAALPGADSRPLDLPASWEQSSLLLKKDLP